jgi:type IX secretion system PorP/SprF family membrane protein
MKNVIILSTLLLSVVGLAQQMPQTNVYGYNKYIINPAYAGASGCTEINFSHLNQWVKIEGAPLTSLLSANTRVGKSLGVGGQILIDKIGMLQQVSGLGSVSYGFTFANVHQVRAGLSLGFNQYRLDPSSAIVFDPNDPIVTGGNQSAGTVNTEIGFTYNWKKLEIAMASKQLIQAYSNFGYEGLNGYGLRRHATMYASYTIDVNDKWAVKPSLFAKGISTGYQLDINADALYKNFIYAGLGYRTNVGLIARAGVNIQDLFFIGYAYETPMSNIAGYSAGSHELMLGLRFCKKEKNKLDQVKAASIDSLRIAKITPINETDTVYISRVDTVYVEKIVESKNAKTKESQSKEKEEGQLPVKSILFEFDKAIVQKVSFGELESLINLLNTRSNLIIALDGHTDAKGQEAYNVNLSKNRVNAVKEFLVANGIKDDRIKINHFGENKPKAENETPEGRKINRRVDIYFIVE